MQTFKSIIDAFGYAVLAETLGCPVGTVSAWRSRDVIPAEHWASVVAAAAGRGIEGVTYETLARLAAQRRGGRVGPVAEVA